MAVLSPPFQMGKPTREAYGRALVELGAENPDLVVLDADLSLSTMTRYFGEAFPKPFFNVGVAEQNLIDIAAGLAACGKVAFASTFAAFATCRAFDQLRLNAAMSRLNVKLAASHAGLTVGEDGISHHAIEDVALMRALPGFTILVPADEIQTRWAVRAAAAHQGPVYLRLGRAPFPIVFTPEAEFHLGRAYLARPGTHATVVANGVMLAAALEAAEMLAGQGIDLRVLNMHTVKPLDAEAVLTAAQETGAIVTAEEHLLAGGLGSAVAEVVVEECPVPMAFVALRDRYAESGGAYELLKLYGLTAQDIAAAVERLVQRQAHQKGKR